MQDNPFTFLGQAISQLLSSNSAALQTAGLDMFRGLAVILIAWFGIKSARLLRRDTADSTSASLPT
jgi:hypothetical protein